MLLSNAKKLYLGKSRVSEVYYGGKKLYPPSVGNWLSSHTWAEIKAACDDKTIVDYVNLGDTIDIDCGTYGVQTFRVVGIRQQMCTNDVTHGLIFQAIKGITTTKWCNSGTCTYPNSLVRSELNNIKAQLPADLVAVMDTANIYYSNSTSKNSQSTTCSSYPIFILSQYEMGYTGSGLVGLSAPYYCRVMGWYETNTPDYENVIWTRDRDLDNAYQLGMYSNNWGLGASSWGDSNTAGIAPCFVI